MPSNLDRGRVTLAGFLYQMLGANALRAAGATDIVENSDGLTALLRLLQADSELVHEVMAEDAAIRTQQAAEGVDVYTLIQFKFSIVTPPEPIGSDDLRMIADHFRASALKAQARGGRVNRYHLITNRNQTDPARELMRNPPEDSLNSGIYRDMTVADNLSLDVFEQWLIGYGREFGARDEQITQGISTLIGDLLLHTVGTSESQITQRAIVGAFTGTPTAQKLTLPSLEARVCEEITRFRTTVSPGNDPIRRQLLNDITAKARKRALVVIAGEGGYGKSVALWQWANEMCAPSSEPHKAPVALDTARRVQRRWPTELLCGWGNYPPGHARFNDREDEVVERLRIANPDTAWPLLFLGLDGLDENLGGADQRHNIENLVRWFVSEDARAQQQIEAPAMTLVVTCRKLRQFWEEFARDDVSGFPESDETSLANVLVDTFSDGELLAAVRQAAPHFLSRIENALLLARGDRSLSFYTDLPVAYGLGRDTQTVDEQVLEAIRHPAMWRAFLLLPEPMLKARALDGRSDARRQMARLFTQRFIDKARSRDRAGGLEAEELDRLLHLIAHSTIATGHEWHSQTAWNDAACATQMVDWRNANRIHREALSGGLLADDHESLWRWRHKFVEEYLAGVNRPEHGRS